MRETEFLKAAENNAIGMNNVEVKTEYTQKNSKFVNCVDRDKTVHQIISEYSKLGQKGYKTRHDCENNVSHLDLIKRLKFDSYYQIVYAQT